jgi:Protein of unknown function (DUF3237)
MEDLVRQNEPLALSTEVLFDLEATVAARQDIGSTPFGRRRVYLVSGGRFVGARLRGEVLPGAADWLLRGADGTSEIDVRATLRTEDGHLVFVHYTGVYYAEPAVKERMDAGEQVAPTEYYFRTTPRFETGSAEYGWLNRVVAVGVGRRTGTGIAYRVYQVT